MRGRRRNTGRGGFVGLLAAGLLLAAPAGAADLEAVLLTGPGPIVLGEEFLLTLEVRGAEAGEARPPNLFALKDLRVLGYPSVHSRYRWVNGRSSFTKSFRYTMMPERAGTIEIPAVQVQVGGRQVTAPGVRIEVVRGAAPGQGPPAPASPERTNRYPAGVVRAVAEVDQVRVYLGEQITLEYRIESPREVRGLELLEQPEFPGFWVEEIPQNPDMDIRRVRRGGASFIEYTVMRRALFPSRPGVLRIEPVVFAITVPRLDSDPIRSFIFESRQTLHRRTDPIPIEVLPLPETGRPADFRGAVGKYRLQVTTDRREMKVNEAMTLRVTVQGRGNLSTLEPPRLETPEEVRPYDPKIIEEWDADEEGVHGRKTWEYVLVPQAPGRFEIPPVRLAYFHPEREAYQTLRSGPITLEVAPDDSLTAPGGGRGTVVARGRDIRFIKSLDGPLRDRSRPLYRHPVTILALVLPALGNGLLFSILRWRRREEVHRARLRRRRAWPRARRALDGVERQAGGGADAVAGILTGYLDDKFNVPAAGLTRTRVESRLARAGVPAGLTREFCDCLDSCDEARFGPNSSGSSERRALVERARRILSRIEKQL